MLKQLRDKKTSKKIWIVLAIIVVPAFVLWGSGSMSSRNRRENQYAGKIFGRNIPTLEFKDSLDASREQMILQFGDKFPEMQKMLNLESQAWERLILLAEARKQGIKVTDNEVISVIKDYPFFQNKSGAFDSRTYAYITRYVFKTQPRQFEEHTRQNVMLTKLFRQITGSITASDAEIKDEYRKLNEQMSIFYIASSPAEFAKGMTVTDAEIEDYFKNNPLKFKQPLSYNLQYAELAVNNDDDTDVKKKLGIIMPRLTKGEDFAKIAKEYNLTLKESGLFEETSSVPGIGWSAQITGMLAKMETGQYLPPIQAEHSYYIVRLKERKEPFTPELNAVKDKVKAALLKERSETTAKKKIDECLEKLRQDYAQDPKSADFEKAAKLAGLKSASTDLFKFGSYIEGIGSSDPFFLQAQKLPEGSFSDVLNVPGGYYIIKLKTKVPFDEKKFETDKANFTQIMLLQKRQEFFTKYLGELKRKAQGV